MTNEKSINKCVLTGLVRQTNVRQTTNGNKVCSFTVMLMEPAQGTDGKQKRQFIDCVSWKGQAERVSAYPVGTKVYVSGRLQSRSWEDKNSGAKRFKTELVCETVEIVPTLQSKPDCAITPEPPITDEDIGF